MAHGFAELDLGTIANGLIAGPRVGTSPLDPSFEWFDAGHPFPNAHSLEAAARALALAERSGSGGWLVVLLSGGASALLAAPAPGLTLEDKMQTARVLMRAGLSIEPLNRVRKHLSNVKGGRLAVAASRTLTLALSDVHGPIADDPSVIGSGPTVADPSTYAEAHEIVAAVDGVPDQVRRHLERGMRGDAPETIKPGDPRLANATYEIIGNRRTALEGAHAAAVALGYTVVEVEWTVEGEARVASHAFVARARQLAAGSGGAICVLGAGETTVTVKGDGSGGRNQEFALAAAPALATFRTPAVLGSAGTDGIDGPTDAAGALVDSSTVARADQLGLDWESTLARNDAYHFFQPLGDLLVWGPTGTNVGDVHVLLFPSLGSDLVFQHSEECCNTRSDPQRDPSRVVSMTLRPSLSLLHQRRQQLHGNLAVRRRIGRL
jgi:glycerate 2-kinase